MNRTAPWLASAAVLFGVHCSSGPGDGGGPTSGSLTGSSGSGMTGAISISGITDGASATGNSSQSGPGGSGDASSGATSIGSSGISNGGSGSDPNAGGSGRSPPVSEASASGSPGDDGGQTGNAADGGGASGSSTGIGPAGNGEAGVVPSDAALADSATAADGQSGPATPSFGTFWSATAVATPSQQLLSASGVTTHRTFIRTSATGSFNWAFWVSNGVDSTFAGGAAMPNHIGGTWRIEAAYVADGGPPPHDGSVVAGTKVAVTFGGSPSKSVQPGERFWSDPVKFNLPVGHDLALSWALSGTQYPFVSASFLTVYRSGQSAAGQDGASGFSATTDVVAPGLIAFDSPVTSRLCFLGDSITQGIGSSVNTYGYWVAKIAAGLGPNVSVWNLGSGWARAADASSDGYWLYKAKQCPEVAVILGVNDFASSGSTSSQVLADLTTIISKLKQNNASTKIILFTVPTFNLAGSALSNWRQTNSTIRSNPPAGADRVFDIAAILSQAAPNDGNLKPQYVSTIAAPHPNDTAGTDIANGFLSWYK